MRHLTFVLPALAILYPVAAHALLVKMPIACKPGENCFIQNYVDHESGSGWKDYRCGHLSYDGHDGTDFAVPTLAEMEVGVNVLAAAKGVVKNIRSNMKDIGIAKVDMSALKDHECGNGVFLEHEDGWSTQYCHMKLNSIQVKPGDEVKPGQILGQVGMSGMAAFPHLHFTLRHDEKIIDPFTGKGPDSICGQSGFSQWKASSQAKMDYSGPGLIAGGFTAETPTPEGIMEGKYKEMTVPAEAGQLLFWVQVYGPREGDVLKMTLREGEDGPVIASHDAPQEKSQARYLKFIGKKNVEPGTYTGTFQLLRDAKTGGQDELVKFETKVSVE